MTTHQLPVELVTRFMRQGPPVDVEGLAKALGLTVSYDWLPDDISGKIEHGADGGFAVAINRGHAATRQRFTLAHEIAHFVLHRDLIGDGVVDDALYRSKTLSDAIERQANRYAADILMPWWLVRSKYEQGITQAQSMAAIFKVSVAVAEIRLKELASMLPGAQGLPARAS